MFTLTTKERSSFVERGDNSISNAYYGNTATKNWEVVFTTILLERKEGGGVGEGGE